MLIYLPTGRRGLNVKVQENPLVGAFSVIVKTDRSFTARSSRNI